jgi:hypothetical protein
VVVVVVVVVLKRLDQYSSKKVYMVPTFDEVTSIYSTVPVHSIVLQYNDKMATMEEEPPV